MIEEFNYNGKAMGTLYFITVICDSKDIADKINIMAEEHIYEYESRYSRFLDTSELSVLNKNKSGVVSGDFLDTTLKSRDLFERTMGIFNPLVQVSRFGYDKNFDDIENKYNVDEGSDYYDIDFSSVFIDINKSAIVLNEGQKLDYGGFLKGYLAEILAKKIKLIYPNINGIIVNIGGDIHTQGLDKDGNKFEFSIYNPILDNFDVKVSLFNQSLATSGTYKRNWTRLDKKMHHILDSSGMNNPDTEIVSASVIHSDGAKTEAYTKVLLSMGDKKALELLEEEFLFIIIKNDGQVIKNVT